MSRSTACCHEPRFLDPVLLLLLLLLLYLRNWSYTLYTGAPRSRLPPRSCVCVCACAGGCVLSHLEDRVSLSVLHAIDVCHGTAVLLLEHALQIEQSSRLAGARRAADVERALARRVGARCHARKRSLDHRPDALPLLCTTDNSAHVVDLSICTNGTGSRARAIGRVRGESVDGALVVAAVRGESVVSRRCCRLDLGPARPLGHRYGGRAFLSSALHGYLRTDREASTSGRLQRQRGDDDNNDINNRSGCIDTKPSSQPSIDTVNAAARCIDTKPSSLNHPSTPSTLPPNPSSLNHPSTPSTLPPNPSSYNHPSSSYNQPQPAASRWLRVWLRRHAGGCCCCCS